MHSHLFLYVDLIWGDFLIEYGFKAIAKRWHVRAELEVEVAFDQVIQIASEVLQDKKELDNEVTSIVTLRKLRNIRLQLGKKFEKLLEEGGRSRVGSRATSNSEQSTLSEGPTTWLMIGEKLSHYSALE
jgi:hypothetical protein